MTEIQLNEGRLVELKASHLPSLIKMSREKDIKDFYFVNSISNEEYWLERLKNQIKERTADSCIRMSYHLPIEDNNIVKGILSIHVEPDVYSSSKENMNDMHGIELSYFIGEEFRKNGIATEVLRKSVDYSFQELNAGFVSSMFLVENIASHNLLRKVGMEKKFQGICQAERARGREVCVYGLTIKEYHELNKEFR